MDAHINADTNKIPENGQKQSRQVPTQPTTQEATQDVGGNRANADIDVPTEITAIGSEKRTMQGDEKGKKEREGKQTSVVQHIQNLEGESPHDSQNSDTSIQTNNETMAQEDLELPA